MKSDQNELKHKPEPAEGPRLVSAALSRVSRVSRVSVHVFLPSIAAACSRLLFLLGGRQDF